MPPNHRRLVAVLVALVALPAGAEVARACSLVLPPLVEGLLGISIDDAAGGVTVPRNAASLEALSTEDGQDVPTAPVDGAPLEGLRRPTAPLEPGTRVVSSFSRATVGDAVDARPPERPEIVGGRLSVSESDDGLLGCGLTEDTCGDFATIRVEVAPTADDLAPPDRITYALFVGRTADEATTTAAVATVQLREVDGTLRVFTDPDDEDRAIWATVVALDQAGNASERSDPFPVHSPDGGCRVDARPAPPAGALAPVAGALAVLAARRRRRFR